MHKKLFILTIIISLAVSGLSSSKEVNKKIDGNLVMEDIPDIPERISLKMLQYQNTRSAIMRDWASDGKGMLISTRFGETRQLHFIKQAGSSRKQLSFFKEPVRNAWMCPDKTKKTFVFQKDTGGNEYYQLYYYNMSTGSYSMFTDGASRNGNVVWSNKGDKFVFNSTKRNNKDWDLYVYNPEKPEKEEIVLKEGGLWEVVDWSPDDKKLIVAKYISINESYYYILDLETKELKQINPKNKKISYGFALWAKKSKGIFITSDEGNEFRKLRYYDLKKQKLTTITKKINWNVDEIAISKSRNKLAFVTNENGVGSLYLLNTKTQKHMKIKGVPKGLIYGLRFHPRGHQLAFVSNTAKTPGDIYVLNISNKKILRWTYSEVGGLNNDNFAEPKIIEYPTFDKVNDKDRMIYAFYYKPKAKKEKYPVVIYIHGGPEGQYTPYFSSRIQYLVNEMDIVFIAPNVRGSAGYGKSYLKLDNGYKREDSVKDIGKLLDWVDKQPELDNTKVAVYGGSYGGYMVLASMTHYNDRLACGVDNVGISNFVTFLKNTKDYRRDLRRVEYGDERDEKMNKFLIEISPTTNAHKITKPMFVVQGLNDPRVPATEAEQIVKTIREKSGNVWYLLANDEGHGFRKKRNRDFYSNVLMLFFEQCLLK